MSEPVLRCSLCPWWTSQSTYAECVRALLEHEQQDHAELVPATLLKEVTAIVLTSQGRHG